MKSKLFLLPTGVTALITAVMVPAVACAPEHTDVTFQINIVKPDIVTFDNTEATIGEAFVSIVDLHDVELSGEGIEIYLDQKTPDITKKLVQDEDFTFKKLAGTDSQYNLTIFKENIYTQDIKIIIHAQEYITVTGECVEAGDVIELEKGSVKQGEMYYSKITVVTPYKYIDLDNPLQIYLNDSTQPLEESGNWEWTHGTPETDPVSHIRIYANVLTEDVTRIRIVANLVDMEDQISISYSGEGGLNPSGVLGFAGMQEGSWVVKLHDQPLDPSDPNLKYVIDGHKDDIWVDNNGKLNWAPSQTSGPIKFKIKAEYTTSQEHKFTAETEEISLTFNPVELKMDIVSGQATESGTETESKQNFVQAQLTINGKKAEECEGCGAVTYTLVVSEGTDHTQEEIDKYFTVSDTGSVSWKKSIPASGLNKPYKFHIHGKCKNENWPEDYEQDSTEIKVSIAEAVPEVLGMSALQGKEGKSGTATQPCSFKLNEKDIEATKVVWAIGEHDVEGISIGSNTGVISWNDEIQGGKTIKFKVKGTYTFKVPEEQYEKKYTAESPYIELNLTELQFLVNGSEKLSGKEGIAGDPVQYSATLDGQVVTTDPNINWTITEHTEDGEQPAPSWIRIGTQTGIVTWDGVVTKEEAANHNFTVTATLSRKWRKTPYVASRTNITFDMKDADITCTGGSTNIIDVKEGTAFDDYADNEKKWICTFNGTTVDWKEINVKPEIDDPEHIAATNFIKIKSDGTLYWPEKTAKIADTDMQNVFVEGVYHDTNLNKDFTVTSQKIHIQIAPASAAIEYNDTEEMPSFSTIEGTGGMSDASLACRFDGDIVSKDEVSWQIVDAGELADQIQIVNDKTSDDFGKIKWSSNIPAPSEEGKPVTFKAQATIKLDWDESRIVTSDTIKLNVTPQILNLTPSVEGPLELEGREGIKGNSLSVLTFASTIGVQGQTPIDVTNNEHTTYTFEDVEARNDGFKDKLTFNKENGSIEWTDTGLTKGTYKVKLTAEYYDQEVIEKRYIATSEVITIDIKENEFVVTGETSDTSPEFTAHDWANQFYPHFKDREDVKFKSNVTFDGDIKDKITAKYEGDGEIKVRPHIDDTVSANTYNITMHVSYTLPSIEKEYKKDVALTLTVTGRSLTIEGGSTTLSSKEWTEGSDTKAWVVTISGETDPITGDCNYEIIDKATETETKLPEGAVWVDKTDGKTHWNNSLSKGTYKFTIKASYVSGPHTYTKETATITLTVTEAEFTLGGGITEFETYEWESGDVGEAKAFSSQIKIGGETTDVTDDTEWSIKADDTRIAQHVHISNGDVNSGIITWDTGLSSDFNNLKFKVVAKYTKESDNTEYTAESADINIKINSAELSVTGGFDEADARAEISGSITDKPFTCALNHGSIVEGDTVEYSITDLAEEFKDKITINKTTGVISYNNLPEPTTELASISFKVNAKLTKAGRTSPYTATKQAKLNILDSPQKEFEKMEWSELVEILHKEEGGGLDALKTRIHLPADQSLDGFTKTVKLTQTVSDVTKEFTYTARVIGTNHDKRDVIFEDTADITFQLLSPILDPSSGSEEAGYSELGHPWATDISTSTPIKDYSTSDINEYLNDTVLSWFDSALQEGILSVKKEYEQFPNPATKEAEVVTGGFKIWLPSGTELNTYLNSYEDVYTPLGTLYSYYDDESRPIPLPEHQSSCYALRDVPTHKDDQGRWYYCDLGQIWAYNTQTEDYPHDYFIQLLDASFSHSFFFCFCV